MAPGLDDSLDNRPRPPLPFRGGSTGGSDADAVIVDDAGSTGSPIGDFDFDLEAGAALARRSHFGLDLVNGFEGRGATSEDVRGLSKESLGSTASCLEALIGRGEGRSEARLLVYSSENPESFALRA